MHQEIVNVEASTVLGDKTSGKITVDHLDQQTRMKRALKVLGIFWGLAIAAVFIPILHFILVPSLLLLGPILGIRTYLATQLLGGIDVQCPSCKRQFRLQRGPLKWPMKEFCQDCRNQVVLEPATSGS